MNLIRNLKHFPNKLFGIIARPNISKPHVYDCEYEVTVKNASKQEHTVQVIIPVPSHTPNQTIQKSPDFSEKLPIRKDSTFVNQYVIWEVLLGAKEEKKFRETFEVSVSPIFPKKYHDCHFKDYQDVHASIKERFCSPNTYVNSRTDKIQKIAAELKGKNESVVAVLKKINAYVVDRLEYGNPIKGLYSAHDALERDMVDCGGFDTLFIALCLALNIPARIAAGFWAGYKNNKMHAWAEVMLPNGDWIPVDPSIEKLSKRHRTKRSGHFGFIGSDRVALSHGCSVPIEIQGKTEYVALLQHPTVFPKEMQKNIFVQTEFRTKVID